MNPNYTEFKFPQIKAHPWAKVFSKRLPPDAVDLVSNQLQSQTGRARPLRNFCYQEPGMSGFPDKMDSPPA